MILDFSILYLDQFKLKQGYTVTQKCSFVEFELTFLIGNHFVQITLRWPPWPLDQSWGPQVAVNNFLWVRTTHRNFTETLRMLRIVPWVIYCCLRKSWLHVNLIEISPFVTCSTFLSYLPQYPFVLLNFWIVLRRFSSPRCSVLQVHETTAILSFWKSGPQTTVSIWISRTGAGID